MKALPLFAIIAFLTSQPVAVSAKESPIKTINDRTIRTGFEAKLGKLKDDGEAPKTADILEQLKNRKTHACELTPFRPLNGASTTANVYKQRQSSVLCFGHIYKCDKCDAWHGNIASGFVISEDGLAVTNYHVMEMAKAGAFGAMTVDGKIHMVEEVLAASKRDDLAIVKLAGDGFTPAPLKPDASIGSKVIAISHPAGRFYTVSEGIISRYYRPSTRKGIGPERISITADFAKGSSGAPVFSDDGGVIGVITSTDSIYYDRDKDGAETNLQMVVKTCIPSSAILNLVSEAKTKEGEPEKEKPEEESKSDKP